MTAEPQLTVIEPRPGWRLIDVAELWKYREMLFFLIWRDIKVKYKQTVLGVLWAIIQPVSFVLVFSAFFGGLADMTTGRAPYPLYVLAGLLPWFFFANAVTTAGNSVVSSQSLITKVYFPRLIIPIAAVAACLVDFAIAFSALFVAMFVFDWGPTVQILWTPLLIVGLACTATGIGTLLAALTVAYRDVRHLLPFLVQLWMFATPSIYMRFNLEGNPTWYNVLPLNPVFGWINNFRAATLNYEWDIRSLIASIVLSIVFLIVGCLYFRRVERSFADII